MFVIYLILGTLMIIGGVIYSIITNRKDKSKGGYNYVNPFDFDV